MVLPMQIRVENMKTQMHLLYNALKEYESDCRNLYNEFHNASSYWQDPRAERFFEQSKLEKLKLDTTLQEMNSLYDLYSYLVEKYERLGSTIFFDFDKKDACLSQVDSTILKIEEIITSYNKLDTSFCPTLGRRLNEEKQKIIKSKNDLVEMKERIKDTFTEIAEIEKNINQKLKKMNIEIIKEDDYQAYIG